MLYSTFTAFLGFPVNEGEYKVMGLAAYGEPRYLDEVRRILRRTPDGAFALDLDYFEYHLSAARSFSRKFVDVFGPPRDAWDPTDLSSDDGRRFADVASSVQRVLEETLVDLARRLHEETGLEDLCLGGGVALNGCANARILRESGFSRVFVPSAPGDAGCALGAALCVDRLHSTAPTARCLTILSGARNRATSRASRAKTDCRWTACATTPRSSAGSPTSCAGDASSGGSKAAANSVPARSGIAASSPRPRTRRCATSSTAASSSARSSVPSLPPSPSTRRPASSSSPPRRSAWAGS